MLNRTHSCPVLRRIATLTLAAAAGLALTACGTTSQMPSTGDMHDMHDMPMGDGLAASAAGFTFAPATRSLPAGAGQAYAFQIRGAGGAPVTTFAEDQTKLMHFYLVRADLTGFQHLHPTMAAGGTWTAPVAALEPGAWRAYVSFVVKGADGRQVPLVLSDTLTVPGLTFAVQLPAATDHTEVDGYTVGIGGSAMANMSHALTVTVSRGGVPVTDLQPYLGTYAHLTAFHEGDLAFAHLHPHGEVNGEHGGPQLSFEAMLPRAGAWRLFLQFQTGGTLHTAAVTLAAG
jgi:hypothetical protein